MGMEYLYGEESYRIMGACFEVYKNKGNGFLEDVYQECLGIEFSDQEIPFVEQYGLALTYKGRTLKKTYKPDFVCFDKIIVELKAVKEIADEHRAQVINYLKATGMELAILVTFGAYPKLKSERFLNSHD